MSTPASPTSPFAPALERFETVLRGLRTGRASAGLVEHLEVEVYGARMKLRDIATITTPDGRTILLEPWDKGHAQVIAKAIATSPLGVNPAATSSLIRVTLPSLTEERRRELAKLVSQHAEETRIAIRNIRERLLKDLRTTKETQGLSEDTVERERKRIQAEVDTATEAIEARARGKEKEILTLPA